MKMPFRKATDSRSIEAELKRLADRKAETERQRVEVLAALEDARQARIDVLDQDDAVVAAATAKLEALAAKAKTLAQTLDDLEVAIERATERFRLAVDQEARTSAAEKLEAVAKAVEGQTAEFAKAAATFAKAAKSMIAAIPAEIGVAPGHHSDRPNSRRVYGMLSGVEMVAACVADALAHELPELFDEGDQYRRSLHAIVDPSAPMPSYTSRELRGPIPAREIVSVLIVDRLRDRAAKIKAGELQPVLDDIRPVAVKPPSVDSFELVATEAVCLFIPNDPHLLEAGSYRKILTEGMSHSFREDHAEKLLKGGRFLQRSSPEGRKFLKDLEEKNSALKRSLHRHGPPEHVDLGDPLGLVQAEREEAARID